MSFSKLTALLAGLMAGFTALSGSAAERSEYNMPPGVTTLSGEVHDLHMLIFWVCVAIAVVVFGVMIYSIFAHRKSIHPNAASFHHNTTVEVVWTIVPFLILIAMAIPSARTLLKQEDFRASEVSIKVTALQWKWKYEYLNDQAEVVYTLYSTLDAESNRIRQKGSGLDPASKENYLLDVDHRVYVPTGRKVRLLLTSADVIHAWWVPDFAVKKDAVPGFINEIWFNVESGNEGVYRGQCAELCGRDHGFMPIVVEAVTPEQFESWLAAKAQGDDAMAAAAVETKAQTAAR